jgi:hypothetical protein
MMMTTPEVERMLEKKVECVRISHR